MSVAYEASNRQWAEREGQVHAVYGEINEYSANVFIEGGLQGFCQV